MDDKTILEIARLECEMRELERMMAARLSKMRRRIERIKKDGRA